jgi:hypothetical protein
VLFSVNLKFSSQIVIFLLKYIFSKFFGLIYIYISLCITNFSIYSRQNLFCQLKKVKFNIPRYDGNVVKTFYLKIFGKLINRMFPILCQLFNKRCILYTRCYGNPRNKKFILKIGIGD